MKKIELKKHGGCKGCVKNCRFNGAVAIPEKAELTKDKLFGCNTQGVGNPIVAFFMAG